MKFYNKSNNEILSYSITKITETKEIKNDKGITLVILKYSYPVIENNNNKFIDNINNEYKYYSDIFASEAYEIKEEAEYLYQERLDGFVPYVRELDYEITLNKNGLLSITNNKYYYNGGVHGTFVKESRTFDLIKEEELSLYNIINTESWDIKENVYKLFEEELVNYGLDLTEYWGKMLKDEIDNVNFYLTDGGLVLYFNVEQVAPYALGQPTVELQYDSNIFLIELNNGINNLVKSLTPTGFAGSSLNKIELYQNGDIYWVQYDGEGIGEENIVKNVLVASNVKDIEMIEDEGINVIGNNVKLLEVLNLDWLKFNN